MQFYTGYFWQQEEEKRKALLLQEVLYRKRLPIIFGCVCTEENENKILGKQKQEGDSSSYLTEQLMEWFYNDALKVCKKGTERELNILEKSITEKLQIIEKELANYPKTRFTGILCVGNLFLLFYQRTQRVCFLNSRFLKPNLKWLGETENLSSKENSVVLLQGSIQKKTGILLATENFYQSIEEDVLKQCLAVGEINQKKQVQRRLEELGQEGIRQGGRNMGAVFLMNI